MLTRIRTSLPFIWGGIVAVLFVLNAVTLRFNLAGYIGATNITPSVQLFGNQVAARDLAWSLFMAYCVWRRDTRLGLVMFLIRIVIEGQDVATLLIGIAQGTQPQAMLGAAIFTLVLMALHGLATWALSHRSIA